MPFGKHLCAEKSTVRITSKAKCAIEENVTRWGRVAPLSLNR